MKETKNENLEGNSWKIGKGFLKFTEHNLCQTRIFRIHIVLVIIFYAYIGYLTRKVKKYRTILHNIMYNY